MRKITMLKDWTRAEDHATSHVLTVGNTFVVDAADAKRAVDEGAAEYAENDREAIGKAPASVDGVPTNSPHMADNAVDTAAKTPPEAKPLTAAQQKRATKKAADDAGKAARGGPATSTAGGEPSPNTIGGDKTAAGALPGEEQEPPKPAAQAGVNEDAPV